MDDTNVRPTADVTARRLIRPKIAKPSGSASGDPSTKQFCMSTFTSAVRLGTTAKSTMIVSPFRNLNSCHDLFVRRDVAGLFSHTLSERRLHFHLTQYRSRA